MSRQAWDRGVPTWVKYTGGAEGQRRIEASWRYLTVHLPNDHKPLRCLDAGCGTGETGLRLVAAGHHCTFLDISPAMLEQVGTSLAHSGEQVRASLLEGDLTTQNKELPAGQFDVVVAHSVIEFLPDPQAGLKELARLLRPGGIVSVVVANAWGQVMRVAFEDRDPMLALTGLHKPLDFCSLSFGLYGRSLTPDQWGALVVAAGLEPVANYGGRILSDFALAGRRPEPAEMERWMELEIALGRTAPYRDMGRVTQIIATVPLNSCERCTPS